MATFFKKSF